MNSTKEFVRASVKGHEWHFVMQVLGRKGCLLDNLWHSWGGLRLSTGNQRHCEGIEALTQHISCY